MTAARMGSFTTDLARMGATMLRGSTSMLHALALALLGIVLQSAEVDAQERARIEIVPQIAHAGDVKAAAFTRDGAHVLTGSKDGTLKLWDIATTRLVRTFVGSQGRCHRGRAVAGRHPRAVGQQGQDRQALGGRDRAADPHHLRASGFAQRGQLRGVLARWQASLVEQPWRGRGQAVGRGDRTARAHVPARQGLIALRRQLGRVLARWHPPGDRRHRRQDRERLERGDRAAPPGLRRARLGTSSIEPRSRSHPTAPACW